MPRLSGVEPRVTRPRMPDGYGVPTGDEGLLPWSHVSELLAEAKHYWIATTRPDGRPHVMPTWAVWLDGVFYFEGSPETRRMRNLAANPSIAVHIERGDDVVILEGVAEEVGKPDPAFAARLVEAFAKYIPTHNYRAQPDQWDRGGLYAVRPRVAFAWNEFPKTTTKYLFDGGDEMG